MKKSMYILILCTMLTGCVNYETPTATANSNAYETTVSATDFTDETVIETASEVYDATELTEETTVTATETTTEIIQTTTEPPQSNLTDYEKALEVYNFMTANGSGTCVQYSYQTYQMCREYGLECYFTWTENKLYGHVANVVKVDGVWYVLDTQGGCFLRENMCGFTEIVDEYENYVADADIISGVQYG